MTSRRIYTDEEKTDKTQWHLVGKTSCRFFWTFFEMSWKVRNDKKFEIENGKREKEQIKKLIEELKVRTRFIP